jgi:hypothetical protein
MIHLELEDRRYLSKLGAIPDVFMTWSRPAEVPVDWHKTENQGQIGSCQGNGLTSILERLQFVAKGDKASVVQLSRIFAYLATQKIDGLLGRDAGSTISGGIKLATTVGVCPESKTGYPLSYPHAQQVKAILSPENYTAAAEFKATEAWQCPQDPDAAMTFIGGGGGISIGIMYYSSLIPRDRVIRSFNPPSRTGGHAMAVLGYKRNGNLIGVNSHADGEYEITPEAWVSMMKHKWTAAVGLAGAEVPRQVVWAEELQWIPDNPIRFSDPLEYQPPVGPNPAGELA